MIGVYIRTTTSYITVTKGIVWGGEKNKRKTAMFSATHFWGKDSCYQAVPAKLGCTQHAYSQPRVSACVDPHHHHHHPHTHTHMQAHAIKPYPSTTTYAAGSGGGGCFSDNR